MDDDKQLLSVLNMGLDLLQGSLDSLANPAAEGRTSAGVAALLQGSLDSLGSPPAAYALIERDRNLVAALKEVAGEILRRQQIRQQAPAVQAPPDDAENDFDAYFWAGFLPDLRDWMESELHTERDSDVHRLVRERASRTLFYPHPPFGCDWNPLFHLSHLCDTFIFADLENRHDIREQLENIQNNTPVGVGLSLVGEVRQFNLDLQPFDGGVSGLGLGNNPDPTLIQESAQMRQLQVVQDLQGCRCWEADIERTVGTTRRLLKVIYIQAGGITAYLRLFHAQNCAPRIVCFRTRCPRWEPFRRPDGLFLRALHAQRDKIEYLLGLQGGEWVKPLMTFHFWHAEQPLEYGPFGGDLARLVCMAKPQHLTVPEGAAATLHNPDSNRSVVLVKGALSDANVPAGIDAVVISEQLLPRDWDDNLYKIVLVAGGMPHAHGRRSFLPNLSSPMGIVLNEITAVCQQQNLKSVACIGLGFEDEAPALQQWLTQEGAPLTLRIHCPDDGDFLSLSGFLR